ncbi:MAG: hypothetical protein GY827_06605 [Cytophagales bacterium]|nr:hypothetical protein [Cytophagales bacterium]
MKKFIFVIALVCSFNLLFGQNFSRMAKYEFKTAKNYQEETRNVRKAVNYLFKNPRNVEEEKRKIAIQFVTKWMIGTPDYSFMIDEKAVELTKGKKYLFSLFMMAMVKAALDNDNKTAHQQETFEHAKYILVNYCADKNNKAKPNKAIKKIIKQQKKQQKP